MNVFEKRIKNFVFNDIFFYILVFILSVSIFKVLNTHVADSRAFAGFGEVFEVRGLGPDCHTDAALIYQEQG